MKRPRVSRQTPTKILLIGSPSGPARGSSIQAAILAAGEAQRLRPLTQRRPKGMLLVGAKPLLQHLVETLKQVGVNKIVLVVGAHAEKIQSFFKDGKDFDISITYAHQSKPTGTADALRHALPLLDLRKRCLVLPGDNHLTHETLGPFLKTKGNTLLLGTSHHRESYGVPSLQGTRLRSLQDAPVEAPTLRVSTGVLYAMPELLEALQDPKNVEAHDMNTFLNRYVEKGGIIETVEAKGPWEDITEPWDLLRLNERILSELPPSKRPNTRGGPVISGPVYIGKQTYVAPTATLLGPVTIGEGCSIGEYSIVGPFVSIRNNTMIGAHCEIRRSILNNNVLVESRSLLRGSIVDDGAQLGSGFACVEENTPQGPVGCVLGSDSEVGPDSRARSGTLLAPDSRIPPDTRLGPGT